MADLEIKEADYTSRFSILTCILTSGYAEFYVNHGSRLRYQDGTALKFFRSYNRIIYNRIYVT